MSTDRILAHFTQAADVLSAFMKDGANLQNILNAGEVMVSSLKQGGKILSCGNGGSQCDAMHFAEELTGRYRENRPAIAAIAISDISHMSCVGNDYGYEFVFSRYLEALGRSGDVLLALSTSGNSPNVIKAAETAKKLGMKVVGLTGKNGGILASLCDVEIRAPHSEFADRAQEIHIKVIHSLIDHIESHI